MKRVYIALFSAMAIVSLIVPTSVANAAVVKRAKTTTKTTKITKTTEAPKHNIVTYPDGSQLDLTSGQVIKNAPPSANVDGSIETSTKIGLTTNLSTQNAAAYRSAVGLIYCEKDSSGFSGTGWLINVPYYGMMVYTNLHVIANDNLKVNESGTYCTLHIRDEDLINQKSVSNNTQYPFEMPTAVVIGREWVNTNTERGKAAWIQQTNTRYQRAYIAGNSTNSEYSVFELDLSNRLRWNKDLNSDFVAIPIGKRLTGNLETSKLNYSLGSLPECNKTMPVGSKVVLIGFPAYAIKDSEGVRMAQQQITEGVITGYDNVITATNLSNPNYFVSAKIDGGNSGGPALSQNENGVCRLGLATWSVQGKYERQGIVLNIANIH